MRRRGHIRDNTKRTTAHYPSIRIADMKLHLMPKNGSAKVEWKWENWDPITFQVRKDYMMRIDTSETSLYIAVNRIPITYTPCNFGGSRAWFVCDCGRRAGRLFIHRDRFACRHCFNLAYPCQNEVPYHRKKRRIRKLESRLKNGDARPKWMHQTTYRKITDKISDLMIERYMIMEEMMEKM